MSGGNRRGVVYELSANETKLIDQMRRVEASFKQTEASGTQAGTNVTRKMKDLEGVSGTAERGVMKLAGAFAGFVSAGAILGQLTAGIQAVARAAEEAGQRIESTADKRARLMQVARSDAHRDELLLRVEEARGTGMSEDRAYDLVFSAQSAGDRFVTKEAIAYQTQMRKIGWDPATIVDSVLKSQSNFGGEGAQDTGGGTLQMNVNKFLAAAGGSPVAAEDIARESATAMQAAASAGANDEDVLALVSVLGKAAKSTTIAGTQVAAAMTVLASKRHLIAGGDGMSAYEIMTSMPELEAQGRLLNEKGESVSLLEWDGREEARHAFTGAYTNREEIGRVWMDVARAEAETGGPNDRVMQKIGFGERDERLPLVWAKERAEAARMLQEDADIGESRLTVGALLEERQRRIMQEGGGDHQSYVKAKLAWAAGSAFAGVFGDRAYMQDPPLKDVPYIAEREILEGRSYLDEATRERIIRWSDGVRETGGIGMFEAPGLHGAAAALRESDRMRGGRNDGPVPVAVMSIEGGGPLGAAGDGGTERAAADMRDAALSMKEAAQALRDVSNGRGDILQGTGASVGLLMRNSGVE